MERTRNVSGLLRETLFHLLNERFFATPIPGTPAHLRHIVYNPPISSMAAVIERINELAKYTETHTQCGLTINDLYDLDWQTFLEVEALVIQMRQQNAHTSSEVEKEFKKP